MSDIIRINNILNAASERKATDIHLVAGNSPVIRAGGKIITLSEEPVLTPEVILSIAESFLKKEDLERLNQEKEVLTVYNWTNRSRFRARVFYQKGYVAISLRLISDYIRSPKDLGIPSSIVQLLNKERGLLIITGPFNSGRTTTAASLLETINQNMGLHIQTLEKPIEYLFTNNQSIIEQREVGVDVGSFSKGIKDILDEDVDVAFIGALYEKDLEERILELAEAGKFVMVVMDADSAVTALERFINRLDAEKRSWGQNMLATVLVGVVAQRLLPRIGGGLILAAEVLTSTSAVISSIKDNRLTQLDNIMQTSREEGMVSLDKSLLELVRVGEISSQDASLFMSTAQTFRR
jgi:twitching motility protein PilT